MLQLKGRPHTTPGTRLAAALGISIACHAALLAARSGDALLPGADPVTEAIAVAVVDRSDGADRSEEPLPAEAAAATAPARPTAAAPPVRSRSQTTSSRHPALPHPSAPGSHDAASAAVDVASAPEGADANQHGEAGATTAFASSPERPPPRAGTGRGDAVAAAAPARTNAAHDDLRAWCRDCPTPDYPARARRQGWQGTVDVQLRVGRDGAVEHAEVGRSSGFAVLDAAAVTVARRSRFWVSSGEGLRGQLRYRFVLEEAQAHRPL